MSPQFFISPPRAFARVLAVLAVLLALFVSGNTSARATTYAVNSLADNTATDGVITLREAMLAANSNFAQGDAPAGGASDTIGFAVSGTITLASALPPISSAMTIAGPASRAVTVSGNNSVSVFRVEGPGNANISNLVISGALNPDQGVGSAILNFGVLTLNGVTVTSNAVIGGSGSIVFNSGTLTVSNSLFSNNTGGAIGNNGPLSVSDSVFSGNKNGATGGAISSAVNSNRINAFTLTLADCVFSGNTSVRDGGALYVDGPLQVARCTFSGNSATGVGLPNDQASFGGAISLNYNNSEQAGAISISDSTLSGNSTPKGGGGGLSMDTDDQAAGNTPAVAMTNCTISGNSALAGGGGIANLTGVLRLQNVTITNNNATGSDNIGDGIASLNDVGVRTEIGNSIVAGNLGNDVSSNFVEDGTASTLVSLGYNLIGNGDNAVFNKTGDQRNVTNARLGVLDNNGGPTQTHLPQSGSPAIDKGNTSLTTDQRGPTFTRPVGAADDIGAVEVGAGPRALNFGVSIVPKAPLTNDTLTATPAFGSDGAGATFTYVWSVNGTVRPNETAKTFDLSKAGNGDKGDRVSVMVSGSNGGARGTATNAVTIINSAPTALNTTTSGNAGAQISAPLRGVDADGDPLTFRRVGGPENGTIQFVTTNGMTDFVYRSRAFFNGVETIRFVAIDSDGKPSDVAEIRITVNAQPRTIGLGVSLVPDGPQTNMILRAQPLIGNDAGVTFAYQWRVNGTVRPGETGQTIDLSKPGNGDRGDTVSVLVTARRGVDRGTAVNSTQIVNAAPVANNATASARAEQQISVPISGSDADGGALTFQRVGGPRNGTGQFVTAANGAVTFVYRSRARFNGVETVRFVAIDDLGRASAPATLTINVTSSVPDIGFGVSLSPRGPKTNDTLTASIAITNARGITFTYAWRVNGAIRPGETSNTLDLSKPGNGDRGDTVTAIVTARRGDSVSTASNSVTVENSAPTARNASASGVSGVEIRVPIVGVDADGDALTFQRVGGPENGVGQFVTDGAGRTTFVYRSRADFVGVETVRFVAADALGRTSRPATITINVTAPASSNASSASAGQTAASGGSS